MATVENDNIAEAKLLLRYGERRSKAKAWLTAALGSDPADGDRHSDNNDLVNTPGPVKDDEITPEIYVSDELSGIGVVKKPSSGDDSLNDRQLSSANEALRRRLLGKDGLKRYADRQKQGSASSKPATTSTKRRKNESDDEDEVEGKGRAKAVTTKDSPLVGHRSSEASEVNNGQRRPGRYLDEILAGRQTKTKQKKPPAKKIAEDD